MENLIKSPSAEMKVVIAIPNGNVETLTSFRIQDKTKSTIKNLYWKKWTTVANLSFKQPCVREELAVSLRKKM